MFIIDSPAEFADPVSATSGETSSMDPSIIQILDYKHADWTKYKHFLTDNVPQITPTRDPDEIDRQIDQLTTTINTAKELAIKIKNIRKTNVHFYREFSIYLN
jgi:hypothetical protein